LTVSGADGRFPVWALVPRLASIDRFAALAFGFLLIPKSRVAVVVLAFRTAMFTHLHPPLWRQLRAINDPDGSALPLIDRGARFVEPVAASPKPLVRWSKE
jgi:hypothetical protein